MVDRQPASPPPTCQRLADEEPAPHRASRTSTRTRNAGTRNGCPADISIVARIIEMDIIPGLLSRPRRPALNGAGHAPNAIAFQVSPEMVERLTRLTIDAGAADCQQFIDRLAAAGLERHSLFTNLFANVARLLGRMWEEDTCTFVEVTIGLSVLQQLIRDNAAHPPIERDGEIRLPSRILLLPAPGDQHIFGILILSNTLDTSLYDIDMEFDVIDADHVTSIVADRPCDCVSFSCSNDRCLDALSESVSKLRAFTGFGRRPIIVGGPAISRSPGIVDELGANGTAGDETGFASLLHRLLYARTASTIARQSLGTA